MSLYPSIRRSFVMVSLLIGWLHGAAQSITGTTCAASGTAYQYTLSGTWTSSTVTWSVTGGTISGSSSGTDLTQVTVTWSGSGTGTISVTTTSPTDNYNLSVTIYAPLTPGAITSGGNQGINYNTTPATITSAAPTGGYCTPAYGYQWWSSTNQYTWNQVTGASGLSLSFGTTTLTQTTYYILQVIEYYTNTVAWSSATAVYVWPAGKSGIVAGFTCMTTGTQDQYTLSCNCTNSTTMSWSVAGGTISGSSSGTALFQIPVNWSRTGTDTVKVITSNPVDTFSLIVNSCPALATGALTSGATQSINYNTTPGNIVCAAAIGGSCTPDYGYQWWYSTNQTTWNLVSGATALSLNFGTTTLTQTTYYLLEVAEYITNTVAYSSVATVTVYPQLVSGSVSPASQTIVSGTTPAALSLSGSFGGNGSYTYQWLSASPAGGSYTSISGATGSTYSPPALTAPMYYEVVITSNGVSVTSIPTAVAIYPPLAAGAITPGSETLVSGTGPGLMTSDPAIGGNGIYHYQWQSSTNGTTFSNISGDTTLTYNPGTLTANTWYQVAVTSNGQTVYSAAVEMNVGAVNSDLNYIRTRDLSKAGVTDTVTADGLTSPYDVRQSMTYFDGLGRPIQTVAKQASPLGNDMVSFQVYDPYGRESTQYLPYTSPSNTGTYKIDPTNEQSNFSSVQYSGEKYYYGQTAYEPSPLNRVSEAFSAGNSWVGGNRGVSQQYEVNGTADSVVLWTISSVAESLPVNSGSYAAGSLYKDVTTDEAGDQVVQYTDLQNHVLLKKVQVAGLPLAGPSGGWLNTYYVYDTIGNLRFVIPPAATQWLQANSLNFGASGGSQMASELCFRYEYDYRHRMYIKKVPGTGEEWMVYDMRDRLVMSQDSNLRAQGVWLTTEYDALNRPDSTGLMTDSHNQSYWENLAGNSISYPNVSAYPYTLQTQTFYDSYSWVSGSGTTLSSTMATNHLSNSNDFITSLNTSPAYAVGDTPFIITRGMTTGTRKIVLGTSQYLYDVTFYDDRGRVIQTQSVNYTGGVDTVTNQYDFTGKPLRNMLSHSKLGNTAQYHTVVTKMDYDPAYRLRHIWKNIDAAASDQLIDSLQYNELGQLSAKYLGNNVDSLVYTYNIRGWLSGINPNYVAGTTNHYFGMELGYDKTTSVASGNTYLTQEYNGNIEGTVWKAAGSGLNRKYDFTYDPVNRITGAAFLQNTSGTSWDKNQVDFSVSNLSYDANGNILSMNQNGFLAGGSKTIDQLSYTYLSGGSNKLMQVMDGQNNPTSQLGDFHYPSTKVVGTNDYAYDGDGNLTQDNNKGITAITYNYLHLPQLIHFQGKGNINYVYDASGAKLAKITADSMAHHSVRTLYLDGMVYQQTDTISNPGGATDTLQFISHEEGRVRWAYRTYTTGPPGYAFSYDFFEKDHLGNTRMLLTQEHDTTNYIATMEAAYRATESQLFANIASTSVAWTSMPNYQNIPNSVRYPNGVTVNDSVSKVDYTGTSGQTTGPSLLLKVMAGDTILPGVQCYYVSNTASSTNSSFNSVLNSLAGGIMGTPTGAAEGTLSGYTASGSPVYSAISSFLTTKDTGRTTNYPKAYLNWILLDDQFNYVSSSSGAVPTASTTYPANQMNTIAPGGPIVMARNGYLYVWVSNETQGWDVFFDNFSVQYKQGPVLEENHYYPFGLTMAGISDKALKSQYAQNKYRYNGKELQNQEFSDGSGLEEYDFGARFQDPQLGRFFNQDRFCEKLYSLSPYQFAANDPLLFVDNNGDSLIVADLSKDNAATDKFKKLSDKSLGGYYTTKVDKEGNVTLEKTDKKGDMTKEQKAFYDNLSGIVDPSKAAVTVGLVQGSNDVLVGSYSLGEIDVDDVEKFEGQIGVTAGGALIHELVEQQTKQLGKLGDNATDYEKAHETGIQAENKVNGSTRGAQGGALKQDIKGQTGAATVNYTQNGNNIKVTLNVVNGNVTSVTSKIENPKKK